MAQPKVALIYNPIYLNHETGEHVENKRRLPAIMTELEQAGLKEKMEPYTGRAATIEEVGLVHSLSYSSVVKTFAQAGGGWLDLDTFISPDSFEVALHAAGGVLQGVEGVMRGEVTRALALVRPPGHHATPHQGMGFCIFNNIAIAARYALRSFSLKRVLIVDFDVHHGNGTQEAFYNSPQVLYFSLHQYPFYPGTGAIDELGEGEGRGYTLNVPLPPGCGDEEYLKVFQEVLAPAARRYQPQLILVSAGYDPHWADGLAEMMVTVSGFARMAGFLRQLAQELCDGRMVVALEGGYHFQALAASVRATAQALLELPPSPDPLGPSPYPYRPPEIDSLIGIVKDVHSLP